MLKCYLQDVDCDSGKECMAKANPGAGMVETGTYECQGIVNDYCNVSVLLNHNKT